MRYIREEILTSLQTNEDVLIKEITREYKQRILSSRESARHLLIEYNNQRSLNPKISDYKNSKEVFNKIVFLNQVNCNEKLEVTDRETIKSSLEFSQAHLWRFATEICTFDKI